MGLLKKRTSGKKMVKLANQKSEMELLHAKELRKIGEEVIRLTAQTGLKYYDLCVYIRKANVSPKLVTTELLGLGFLKQRITEVNRVAQASEATWNEFEAKTIGFQKALEIIRGSVPRLLGNVIDVSESQVIVLAEKLEKQKDSEDTDKATPDEKNKRKFESACAVALKMAEFFNVRNKKVTLGNGWVLTISKEKRKPVKVTRQSVSAPPANATEQVPVVVNA